MTITTARLSVHVALVLFGLLHCGSGLSIAQPRSQTSSTARSSGARLSFSLSLVKDGGNSNVNSDFPPEEELTAEYKGSVDWDAEWKKVVQSGGSVKTSTTTGGAERPGKDYYKSEAEIAAIVRTNNYVHGKMSALLGSIAVTRDGVP
jgi:hypothetical protein